MLARRRRERRHASLLAARIRFNKVSFVFLRPNKWYHQIIGHRRVFIICSTYKTSAVYVQSSCEKVVPRGTLLCFVVIYTYIKQRLFFFRLYSTRAGADFVLMISGTTPQAASRFDLDQTNHPPATTLALTFAIIPFTRRLVLPVPVPVLTPAPVPTPGER